VIAASSSTAAFAVKNATTAVPIVFVVCDDPVRLGLVASLARPRGNLTGINWFATEVTAKRLELLRDMVPATTRFALLVEPSNPTITEPTVRDVETAARSMGLRCAFSTPTPGTRSMEPSRPLCTIDPTPCSSAKRVFQRRPCAIGAMALSAPRHVFQSSKCRSRRAL
jgi:hypothetical protein